MPLEEVRPSFEGTNLESVLQWILNELIVTYGFPREWLGNRILLVDSKSPTTPSRDFFGLEITTRTGNPFMWVSVQPPGQATRAETLLQDALLRSSYTGIGISSDGSPTGTRILRRRFDNEQCETLNDLEPYGGPTWTTSYPPFTPGKHTQTEKRKAQRATVPLSDRLENIFFEAQSHIRDIDGMHADEALDEVSKVLYCKLYDEETTKAGKPYRMQKVVYGCTEEMAASVRALYQEANDYDVRVFSLRVPEYQRSRGVFSSKIRLSSPALIKVVETFQEYDVSRSTTDVKGRAFQKMLTPTMRAGMGQYFTPDPVVQLMVNITAPQVHDLILDPFCGSARFLTRSLKFVATNFNGRSKKALP